MIAEKPKVSVIIPVWNPGPEISRCIESLRNQTLKEIEMIFVDDLGSDDSMDKVILAAQEDQRIKIIENAENIGAGPSRNKGIEAAQGDYLSFVDSDDYVAADFIELLYNEAQMRSMDIVKGRIVYIKDAGLAFARDRELNSRIRKGLSANKSLYTLFNYEHHSAIYRRELLLKNNIRYGGSARAQDLTFLLKVCSQADSFSIVDNANYYFCARQNSTMHTMDVTRLQGHLRSISERLDYILSSMPLDDEVGLYLQGIFLGGLREYYRYNSCSGMENAAQSYLRGLRGEMERVDLPSNYPFPLRVFKEYDIALPTIPYYLPWEGSNPPLRYAELVRHWVDFYLSHPEENGPCWKELKKLVIKADKAVHGKPHSTYTKVEQKQGRLLLKHQIKRLPWDLQLKLRLLIVKNKAD